MRNSEKISGRENGDSIGKPKHTYEFIKQKFADAGLELLEETYVGSQAKMKYRCKTCGIEHSISYSNLSQGCGCPRCSGVLKPTYDFVKGKFSEAGLELLEKTYVNNRTKLKYRCLTCGLIHSITYGSLSRGVGCPRCADKKQSDALRLPYEFIKQKFKEAGLELLEKTYVDSSVKMEYKCQRCNLIHSITYNNLSNGQGCPRCADKKQSDALRLPYEFIKQKFKEAGLELLDRIYTNAQVKLKYRCLTCGLIHSITYGSLSQGQGCPHCASSKGEKLISKFCKHYHISFKSQYSFDNLKYKQRLKFDFGIIRNNQLLFLIEFNGIQHYKPVEHFGGEPQFKLQQHLDHLKSTYCKSHGIPLHIIRYDEDTTGRLNEIFQDYFGERMITKVKRLFSA